MRISNNSSDYYCNTNNPEELKPDMSHRIFAVIIFGLMLIGVIIFLKSI